MAPEWQVPTEQVHLADQMDPKDRADRMAPKDQAHRADLTAPALESLVA